MFEKLVIIDGKGHLLGRLASIVAKELLNGQRIVVVRCELLNKSGSLFRNKIKFHEFLNKSSSHNPRKWLQHYKAPSRILWRSIRGMIPHKQVKGAAALAKLKVFDGVPAPYDTRKRQVVPKALKVLQLKSHRKFCVLGDLCNQVGWKKQSLLKRLEENRKVRSHKSYERRLERVNQQRKAENLPAVRELKTKLAAMGY